jgi:DNA gyrase subunit A
MGLKKNDKLNDVKLTNGKQDIIIGTKEGMAIRFHEEEARAMGRAAAGVRGIRLNKGDKVVGAVTLHRSDTTILVATQRGYGKRSEASEYRVSHRGGKGIITVKTSDKTGTMVAIKEVTDTDDVVVVTSGGMVIRQHATDIRVAGRITQGVRLIRLDSDDVVADVAAVIAEEAEDKKLEEDADKAGSTREDGMKDGKEGSKAEVRGAKEKLAAKKAEKGKKGGREKSKKRK